MEYDIITTYHENFEIFSKFCPPRIILREGEKPSKEGITGISRANNPEDAILQLFKLSHKPGSVSINSRTPEDRMALLEWADTNFDKFEALPKEYKPHFSLNSFRHQITNELKYSQITDPNLSPEQVEKLADDKNPRVRQTIAKRPDLPLKLMEKLAFNDNEWKVRTAIAERKDLPFELAEKMANAKNSMTRQAIAAREGLPPKLIEILARDDDKYVRAAIARNPSTPPEIIGELAGDEDRFVRDTVAKRDDLPSVAKQLEGDYKYTRKAIADEPHLTNLSFDELVKAAKDMPDHVPDDKDKTFQRAERAGEAR